jgi:hypothetical protein
VNIQASGIFEEVPLKVHNSHLVHAFLYELREQKEMAYVPAALRRALWFTAVCRLQVHLLTGRRARVAVATTSA